MKYFALTNKGFKRTRNEDAYSIGFNLNHDVLLYVCDGVGGSNAGDVASNTLARFIAEDFSNRQAFKNDLEIIQYLKEVIRKASDEIYTMSIVNEKYNGMGSTITGLLIANDGAFVFNVGDSRVYGHNNGLLKQLTVDDNLQNKLSYEKVVSAKEIENHPQKNYLTNVCGMWANVKVNVFKLHETYEHFLICSDGLSSYVEEKVILDIIQNNEVSLQFKVKELIKMSLDSGGNDNVTVILGKWGDCNGKNDS